MKNLLKVAPVAIIAVLLVSLTVLTGCQPAQPPDPAQKLKPVIDAFLGVWNTGNVDALDEIADSLFELRMSSTKFAPVVGLDALKREITNIRTMYPDFSVNIDENAYLSERVLVKRWTIKATYAGPDSLATIGQTLVAPGFSVIFFKDGKISGEWIATSDVDWMKQLGFTLVPPQAPEMKKVEEVKGAAGKVPPPAPKKK